MHAVIADLPEFAAFAEAKDKIAAEQERALAEVRTARENYQRALRETAPGSPLPPAPDVDDRTVRRHVTALSEQLDQERTAWVKANYPDLVGRLYDTEDKLAAKAAKAVAVLDAVHTEWMEILQSLDRLSTIAGQRSDHLRGFGGEEMLWLIAAARTDTRFARAPHPTEADARDAKKPR